MGNIAEILNIKPYDTASKQANKQASNYGNNLEIQHHLSDVNLRPCTTCTRTFCAGKNYGE